MTKQRGDSKLKTLPPEVQRTIFGWVCAGTYESALERIQFELGISTSIASLSDFYSWYALGQRLEKAASVADNLKQWLTEVPGLNLDDTQVSKAAQAAFEMQAVEEGDKKFFLGLINARQNDKRLSQNDRKLNLDQAKFEWDAAKAVLAHLATLKAIKDDKGLSEDQKLEAVRLRLFGMVPSEVPA